MQLARIRASEDTVVAGYIEGDALYPLLPGDGPGGHEAIVDIAMAHRRGDRLKPTDPIPLSEGRLLPPVPQPNSIRDFLAFEEHVRNVRKGRGLDVDPDWFELPVFYFTNPAVVYGTGDTIPHPKATEALDYELELAAVVGRDASDVTPAEAAELIAGYTVFNDFSARDVQLREMQQMLGPAKGKDFANAFGPVLVTPDELPGGDEGRPKGTMIARVNGEEWSRGDLDDCHWSFADMISYASRDSRLRRGDIIGSGTVGTGCILELQLVHGADARPWLRPGDTVELEIEGVGVLRNTIGEPGTPQPAN